MTYPEPITELNPESFVYIVCRQSWCCLTLTQNAARVALFDLRNIDILVAEGSITMIITTDCLRATEAAIDYCSTTCTGAAEGGSHESVKPIDWYCTYIHCAVCTISRKASDI